MSGKGLVVQAASCLLAVLWVAGAAAAAELVTTQSDWKVYRHGEGRELRCFAVTAETADKTGAAGAATAHAYITAWPGQGTRGEVSVHLGRRLAPDAEISAEIADSTFTFTADGDRAYVKAAAEERRLVEAMRRGVRMTVELEAADGTPIGKHTFSLSGVTAALQAIIGACE
jgi:hypothetical protein